MTTLATRETGGETREGRRAAGRSLVVFGIASDLARVMTYYSPYRLEQRGLLRLPIGALVGEPGGGREPWVRS